MSEPLILADHLSKTYRVSQRPPGLKASLAGLFRRTYHDVPAVTDVTFAIAPGEVVGFIGPNGAGKTTTLKLLAGLLQPSAGAAHVAGFTPGDRRPDYLRRIALVMGNKSQMLWDIPALDTFHVLGEIYAVPRPELNRTVGELVSLLGLESLLTTPVRNLSLGERMKCELVASLLHRPQVLFLDEPTLGLDVSSQRRLRAFIAEYNRRWGATILLTSHYMADVVELCPRVLLIQEGKLLYDGPLPELSARLAPFKLVRLTLSADATLNGSLPCGAVLVEPAGEHEAEPISTKRTGAEPTGAEPTGSEHRGAEYPAGTSLTFRIDRGRTAAITAGLLTALPIADLVVEDPPIEAVIDQIYTGGLL